MGSKQAIEHCALAIVTAVGLTAALIIMSVAHRETNARLPGNTIVIADGADRAAAAPLPYGAAASAESTLGSITCPAPLSCIATGWYLDGYGNAQALIVTTEGELWDSQTAPVPRDASPEPNAQFGSITCVKLTYCVAVGSYDTPNSPDPHAMLVTGSGYSWAVTATPLPRNADASGGSQLGSITCPEPSQCVAVGSYSNSAATRHGLIVIRTASSWMAVRAPLPVGVPSDRDSDLTYVTCTSDNTCAGAGTYSDTPGDDQGFLLWGSGRSWTAVRAPLPSDAAAVGTSGRTVSISAIDCPSAHRCVALGSYTDKAGYPRGMLLTGAGTRWAAHSVPIPAGVFAPYDTAVNAIVCPSPVRCVITGSYTDVYKYPHATLITGAGAAWHATEAPLPTGAIAADPSDIGAIACPSASTCVASGGYVDRHGYIQSMLVSSSPSSSSATEVVMPAGTQTAKLADVASGFIGSDLSTVACSSIGECLAAGSYGTASGHDRALLATPLSGPHTWPDLYIQTAFTIGLYTYPGFPVSIGLDNHSFISGIHWRTVSSDAATATGTLTTDDCTPDCAAGRSINYPVKLIAGSPRKCLVHQTFPPRLSHEYIFSKIAIVAVAARASRYLTGLMPLAPACG